MANDIEKKPDILEDIKRIDRAVRAKTLAQVLSTLKEKAHDILELKEETNALLETAGVSAEDAKRIIDFVNSLDDVQLSDADKRKIHEEAREEVSEVRQKAEKKVNESPIATSGFVSVPAFTTTDGSTNGYGYYHANTFPVTYTTSSSNGLVMGGSSNQPINQNFCSTVGYKVTGSSATLSSGTSSLAVRL